MESTSSPPMFVPAKPYQGKKRLMMKRTLAPAAPSSFCSRVSEFT